MKINAKFLFLATVLLAAVIPAQALPQKSGVVHWVIDGDTFQLETGERVRMIGMNTPEYMPWKNHIEPYGKEAAQFSKNLLTRKKVFLEADIEPKDKYGRSLYYVYLEDGTFVNLLLVEKGFAKAKAYKPNTRRYRELKNAEREAKSRSLGLWKKPANANL